MKKNNIVIRIISIFLIIGLVGGIYAYKEYHRKNIDIADTKAAFVITDEELVKAFTGDQAGSNKKYLGKLLEVSGNIKKIDVDANGYHTVVLGKENEMNAVRCSIDSSFNKEATHLKAGTTVVIKGICTGYNADDLGLGSDVILNRSIAILK